MMRRATLAQFLVALKGAGMGRCPWLGKLRSAEMRLSSCLISVS